MVLVDDTPLAFLHQPDNGIPMLAYRGGVDDKLLLEAVLPLLQVRLHAPRVHVGCACMCVCAVSNVVHDLLMCRIPNGSACACSTKSHLDAACC